MPPPSTSFPPSLPEILAAPDGAKQTCLSFNREMCPPLNLSIQTPAQQAETHKRCGAHVALERVFQKEGGNARFCGRRLPRLNPCWVERGKTSCLPHFFILGEMKCGTTSLYHFLRRHPRVVVPRVKEPRFLQAGRFPQTTVSRYKVNFDVAVPSPQLVTFDASPVYLRSAIAREWLSRWLPGARLITLVRNPTQRAYSHWKMGTEWMESKCTSADELHRLRPLRKHLTFERLMERSLLQEDWSMCANRLQRVHNLKVPPTPHSFTWMKLPAADIERVSSFLIQSANNGPGGETAPPADGESGSALWDCLRDTDFELVGRFADELLGRWPLEDERVALDDAVRLLGHCSEMMLYPPGALVKGGQYAAELEEWAKLYPRSQLKVIHTDELSGQGMAQKIMDDTFRFLGLAPIDLPANETRMCVHGKAGVMDVLNAFEGSVRIGTAHAAPEQLNVGKCDTSALVKGMHRDAATGAMHHDIEPHLQRRMRAYYEPMNQRLYRFLGKNLGW